MVRLRSGHWRPKVVADIKRIPALRSDILETDSGIRIGALTTMSDLVQDERIQTRFAALAEAASVVGSVQIRNRATLAGNICNASPAADTAPALLVYRAVVNLTGKAGTRAVPIAEFFTGPGQTVMQRGEIVESIDLPLDRKPGGAAFGRVTRRRGVDLATINLSCRVSDAGEAFLAYGAVGPRPLLVRDGSGVLADPGSSPAAKTEVLDRLMNVATPITDVRGGRDYRLAMLSVMSRRVLDTAIQRMRQTERAI